MLKKTYLCDSSQKFYDPYLRELNGWGSRFNLGQTQLDKPSFLLKKGIDPQVIYEELDRLFLSTLTDKWNELLEYEREMLKKCGPQGGKIGISDATKLLESYYSVPTKQKFNLTKVGRDSFIKEIRHKVQEVGLPQPVWEFNIRNTAGGLPTCAKKNVVLGNSSYYIAHVTGDSHPFGPIYPTLVANRIMRQKLRLVFMDAAQNVDRIEPILSSVRNWFKQYYPELFAGLHNPKKFLWRKIARALKKRQVDLETDFNAMDRWMTRRIVKFVMLPILKELLIPSDYLEAQIMLEAYFSQECVFRNQLWEGEHTLFSGQPPTQDLENFYDICLYWGVYATLNYTWDEFVSSFTMVGDDVLAFFKNLADAKDALKLVEDETDLNKVLLSKEKTRIGCSTARFCRSTYSERTPRILDENQEEVFPGINTLALATMTIVQPERINSNPYIEIAACIARSDNVRYHPRWKAWATWIFSKLDIRNLPTPEQFLEAQYNDWWTKLYGESYGLDQSPTYQLWSSLMVERDTANRVK